MQKKSTQFTKENARANQLKSAEKHKENTARKRALREILFDELAKPISKDSKITKLEWLVMKAIDNTRDGVELSDLLKIQELLGEKQMTFNFENRKPSEVARDILDEIGE